MDFDILFGKNVIIMSILLTRCESRDISRSIETLHVKIGAMEGDDGVGATETL